MSYVVAVDIGGTFTDCVVVDEAGTMTVAKAFSTPPDFSEGVVNALRAQEAGTGLVLAELLERTTLFLHATSIAENAIVDGTLTPAGLLVTRGFEDALRMMRGGYGRWSGLTEEAKKDVLQGEKPVPLIPSSMIVGIAERTDSAGRVLAPAEDEEIERAVRQLVEGGAESIGVCFLWSFRNGENEQRVRKVVRKLYPNIFFTMSSELSPVEGEYERTSTVALNVRLGPVIERYLGRLRGRLAEHGYTGPMLVMQAHGGLLSVDAAPARSVGMIESGPVSGLVGSAAIGELIDLPKILATDMGGTTFKAGVVRDGRIDVERETNVLRYHYSLQKMEIVSIGLAGGSIISLEQGLPKIGPRSAGALPGPVCYGFGGTEPTVTDVDLLLGYLDSRFFLGGRAELNVDAALDAFRRTISDPLGMEPIEAAAAVQRLANSMIYDLLHKQTIEKGLDPTEYAMLSYGGTAGMHMTSIAPELGISRIIIPHSASVHGAFGLVSADIVHSEVTTRVLPLPSDPPEINAIFDELVARVLESVEAQNRRRDEVVIERLLGIRYQRQVHAITVPVSGREPLVLEDLREIASRFEALYTERYGPEAGYREAGMELVSFGVRGVVPLERPHLRKEALGPVSPESAYVETKRAYFGDSMTDARCYDFERLRPGNRIEGPAIVWSPITTLVVNPGQQVRCDEYMNMIVF